MPNIEKLKQEAEEARDTTVKALSGAVPCWMAEKIADALIRATALHLKVQAAEKEAEQENDEPSFECNRSHPHENMSYGCLRKTVEARLTANPTPIADDGWIKWDGGECPGDMRVLVKYRDGRTSKKDYLANNYLWQHDGTDDDIIAYRIIQPAADRVEES